MSLYVGFVRSGLNICHKYLQSYRKWSHLHTWKEFTLIILIFLTINIIFSLHHLFESKNLWALHAAKTIVKNVYEKLNMFINQIVSHSGYMILRHVWSWTVQTLGLWV
jgi:hypothetical protein